MYTAPTTNEVHIESSAVLKIVKHGSKSFPNLVRGPLLGLDSTDETLTISHAFPYSGDQSDQQVSRSRSGEKYIQDLTVQLKAVGYATQFVGWYQCATSSSFFNKTINDLLLQAQMNENPNSVLLVFDASKVKKGVLSLRAFRLSENYIKAYIANENSLKLDRKTLNDFDLNYTNYLEELPVYIHNSQLVSLYLCSLRTQANDYELDDLNVNSLLESETFSSKPHILSNFDSLKVAGDNDITETSAKLVETMDSFVQDLIKFSGVQRSYARESAKIEQWKQTVKENDGKFEGKEVDLENDWKTALRLPVASRHENFFNSTILSGYCADMTSSGAADLVKGFSIKSGLDV